jgi:ABC-type dipeptide/oligopeptide/nickel transport system ATPase subunit
MLSDEAKAIKMVMQDISNSMTRIDGEKDFIKESINELSEKHSIPKKNLNKVARIIHKQNMAEVQADNNDVEELYENLTK